MKAEQKRRALNEIAAGATPDTVDLWPSIQSRVRPRASGSIDRRRLRLAVGLVAAVLLAVLASLSPWSSRPQAVSAEAILARAQTAAEAPSARSYHLQMTSRSGVKPFTTSLREAWFDGNRARQTFKILDASGATTTVIDLIFDGTQSWTVVTANGQTNVVHSSGTDMKTRAEGLGQQGSLSEFLALYNHEKGCMVARLDGEGIVAGRPTYRVVVESNYPACQTEPANAIEPSEHKAPTPESDKQTESDRALKAEKMMKEFVIWVDKETYLPLKTAMLTQSGEILDESETTSVEYDVAIPDSTFAYTPPAGATVSELGDKGKLPTAR